MKKKRPTTTTGGTKPNRATAKAAKPPKDWVPIQVPENLEGMFLNWVECDEPNVGWCMLGDHPIRSAADLIPNTNTHNCEAGRALEEKIRLAETAKSPRKRGGWRTSRAESREQPRRNIAREPQVGIFWWLNDRLIAD